MQTGVVEWVAPLVRRIVAPNPSAMTGPGTNSYLLGCGDDLILVDPGPLIDCHITALLASLDIGERIAKIIVTHPHLDHSAAAPRVSALTKAPILAYGDATSGRSAIMQRLAHAGMAGGGEGVDYHFRPTVTVADGEQISAGSTTARIIHTPGHMGSHICLALGDVILSGDHVMAWASSLISPPDGDMGAYMASLDRLAAVQWSLMLPGHGAAIPDVATRLAALKAHRLAREASILSVLSRGPATPETLTLQLYTDTPTALIPAASRNVLAHLIDLTERNRVRSQDPPGPQTIFISLPLNP